MIDELAHGTSWAVLLCYSNFKISIYDGSKLALAREAESRKHSQVLEPRWNKRCGYAIHHCEENIGIHIEIGAGQLSFPLISATTSLVY
jgi:hypothetical protein